jgi:hypothetical protein
LTLERDAVELVAKPIKQFERTNQNRCNTLGRPPRSFICVHFSYEYFFFFLSISIHFLKGIFERIFGSTVSYIHSYIYGCVRACVFSWKIVVFDGCIETLMHKTLNSGATRQLPQGYASGITNQGG